MIRRFLMVAALVVASAALAFSQNAVGSSSDTSRFAIGLNPGLTVPLGGNADLFGIGGGATLSGRYSIPALPGVFVRAQVGYDLLPIDSANTLSILAAGLGGGVSFPIAPRLSGSAFGSGGLFFATLSGGQGSDWYPQAGGGAGLAYRLTSRVALSLEASYRYLFGLTSNFSAGIGAEYRFPGPAASSSRPPVDASRQLVPLQAGERKKKSSGVDMADVQLSVFPVLFKYYDTHPVGKAVLVNYGKDPIDDIRVTFFVKQYMDNPKECLAPESLPGRAEGQVELYGLLTNRVLEISEDTKVSANIVAEYTLKGKKQRAEFVETLRFYNRNATTWDDDRKAAAFVTAKDTSVLKFSKNIAGMVKDAASRALNSNLLMAIALHEALSQYDLSYVIDPSTPYIEFSKNKQAVDYLQFPSQTLEFKAGDCDDLSILYCALLESVGIRTAFITVPEHIFMAFSLDVTPDEARRGFAHPEDLIVVGNNAWLPVEVTERKGGFLTAWSVGAKQWREQSTKDQVHFFPLAEAWQEYEPVGFTEPGDKVQLPEKNSVVSAYLREVMKYIDREIFAQKEALVSEINRTGSIRAINKLGVLYARYGLNDQAAAQFAKVLAKAKDDVPALLNMGNIYYLRNDLAEARKYYEAAARKAPSNANVLLALARVNHDTENYSAASVAYSQLKNVDPHLAEQFAYLELRGSDAARAADMSKAKGVMVWSQE